MTRPGFLLVAALLVLATGCAAGPAPEPVVPVTTPTTASTPVPAPAPDTDGAAPRSAPLRIMPLGDSITAGFDETHRYRDGYRLGLWQRLVAQDGRAVEFVGSQHTPADAGVIDLPHEGYGGYRIDQVRWSLDAALTAFYPDVVLLHLGSNDLGQAYHVDSAPDRLAEFAGHVCSSRPGVALVVASITPIPGLQAQVDAFNARVPGIVDDLRASGCRAQYADMASAVPPTSLFDGVHPSSAGYEQMAAAWYPYVVRAYDGTFG